MVYHWYSLDAHSIASRAGDAHSRIDDTDSRAMPDHATLLDNLWLLGGISLGGGAFASQVAGVAGDLGFGVKVLITLGIAAIIFATIWFSAPAHT